MGILTKKRVCYSLRNLCHGEEKGRLVEKWGILIAEKLLRECYKTLKICFLPKNFQIIL